MLAALAAAGVLAGCSVPQPVEVPPPDAGPVEVVRAYVAAINARDRTALATLSEDGTVPVAWLGTTTDLVKVSEPYENAGTGTKHDGEDVVGVPVTAVFHHTDGSLPNGEPLGWTYLLVQQDGRWVVFDQGQG
jgi:hypothetical protein